MSYHQSSRGIAAWKYFPWTNWANGRDNGQLKRVTYNKQRNNTILRVAFHSTLAMYNKERCSEWYITFSGKECTQPDHISTSIMKHLDRDGWHGLPTQLSGFCNATSSYFPQGPVVISVHVRACPSSRAGDAHTGYWDWGEKVTSSLVVEEYCS